MNNLLLSYIPLQPFFLKIFNNFKMYSISQLGHTLRFSPSIIFLLVGLGGR